MLRLPSIFVRFSRPGFGAAFFAAGRGPPLRLACRLHRGTAAGGVGVVVGAKATSEDEVEAVAHACVVAGSRVLGRATRAVVQSRSNATGVRCAVVVCGDAGVWCCAVYCTPSTDSLTLR